MTCCIFFYSLPVFLVYFLQFISIFTLSRFTWSTNHPIARTGILFSVNLGPIFLIEYSCQLKRDTIFELLTVYFCSRSHLIRVFSSKYWLLSLINIWRILCVPSAWMLWIHYIFPWQGFFSSYFRRRRRKKNESVLEFYFVCIINYAKRRKNRSWTTENSKWLGVTKPLRWTACESREKKTQHTPKWIK